MQRIYDLTSSVVVPLGRLVAAPTLALGRSARAVLRLLAFAAVTLWAWAVASVTAWTLRRASEEDRWRAGVATMQRWGHRCNRILGLDVEVRGHRPPEGALIVANHRSYLDITAFAEATRCFFLAKAEIGSWPFIGAGARAVGVAFVRREDASSRRSAADEVARRLAAGFTLVNFPEGTTHGGDQPLPFRPGIFRRVAGSELQVVPATIQLRGEGLDWVGDATFLPHLFQVAMRPRTVVRIVFSEPLRAADFADGDALRDAAWERVAVPLPVDEPDAEAGLSWLRAPWKRTLSARVLGRRFVVRVHDQPGRWMAERDLRKLEADLRHVAAGSLDEVPTYGVFAGTRAALANRVVAVLYFARTMTPVAFTAMVYLPVETAGKVLPVIHLGLTMIRKEARGQRLQTPLFKKVFLLPVLNQHRLRFTITSIAASPAGIGAASDYFQDTFPAYHGRTERQAWHLDVARQVVGAQRHEFGCSRSARFDPNTFVVHGSNDPSEGGAWQFIKDDPVSRYRVDACNTFCREVLDFASGDELFQVGRADLLRGLWQSRASKRAPGSTDRGGQGTFPRRASLPSAA
jgi:1-acyl-sn-glycerol-3-phosphate acyltransferase